MIWIPKNIFGDEPPIASLFDKFFYLFLILTIAGYHENMSKNTMERN